MPASSTSCSIRKQYSAAEALIARYHAAFPARRSLPHPRPGAARNPARGNVDQALAVYDRAFEPLWPADLVQSYFALLEPDPPPARVRRRRPRPPRRAPRRPRGPQRPRPHLLLRPAARPPRRGPANPRAFRIAREAAQRQPGPPPTSTPSPRSPPPPTTTPKPPATTTRWPPPPGTLAERRTRRAIRPRRPHPPPARRARPAHRPRRRQPHPLPRYRHARPGPRLLERHPLPLAQRHLARVRIQRRNAKAQTYFHRAKAAELLAQLDQRFPAAPSAPRSTPN